MGAVLTCPDCDREFLTEESAGDEVVVCPHCGYVLDESEADPSRVEDMIELDLASDGELDGELFDF